MATEEWILNNQDKIKEYRRKWYALNKARAKNAVNQRRKDLKNWFKEYKSSLRCSVCTENDVACMDFHHTDPSKKEFSIAIALASGFSKERILKEIEKTVVLCANCHRKFHYYNDSLD